MDYIELKIEILSTDIPLIKEILVAQLSELEFESFIEESDCVKAYIPSHLYNKEILHNISLLNDESAFKVSDKLISDQNWNAEWESNFQPIIISDQCIIRAPFHTGLPSYTYEIIIEPKMSFGTGHHETTSLLIEDCLKRDFLDKDVLDMGCGTGILGIFAAMKGAKNVLGIDIDDWAYENTLENIERNNADKMKVLKGDASLLGAKVFGFIFANINLNILLKDMSTYADVLKEKGEIVFSGFYINDLETIKAEAVKNNLSFDYYTEKNEWVCAAFHKT